MASKEATPLSQTIRDDFLTCKICFNTYDNPKILPCVHTYCSRCIEQLLEKSPKSGSISCPMCRERVTLPHKNISDLKTNFLINSLIDVLRVKTNNDVECTACTLMGNASYATCRCLDCGDYLCSFCSDGHNSSSTTWQHRKVLLEDIKEGSYDRELRNMNKLTCSQHKDKEIEYFCERCQIPICLACVLLEHRDHKCVAASEAVTIQKRRLINHADKVKDKLQQLETEMQSACDDLENVEQREAEAIANIEEQTAVIIDKIECTKENALHMVDNCMEEKLNQCRSEIENTHFKMSLATSCLEFCETMIEQGKDEEVLYLEETLTKRLQQLQDIPTLVDAFPSDREVFPNIDEQACGLQDFECLLNKHMDNLVVESEPNFRPGPKYPKVAFQLLRSFNTEYDSDSLDPIVNSITISNNVIFLSDSANGKIKCISTSGVLKKYLTTGERFSPFAVAVCKTTTAAVDETSLYLFNKKGKLTNRILISSNSSTGLLFTFALANYKNEGFILGNLSDNHMRMYATDGSLKHMWNTSVSCPLANLSVDKSGNLITCEWGDSCVRVRTRQGKILAYCQAAPSWKPLAAQEDKHGLIYAVNNFRNTVSVFERNGAHVLQHATRPDGMVKPVSLAFDEEGLLYLASSSGMINVYAIIVDGTK